MIPKGQLSQQVHSQGHQEPAIIESPKSISIRALASQQLLSNSYRSVWLFGFLIALAIIYTLYLTKTLLLPIFVSAFISALLSPIVYRLEKLKLPRSVSSIALVAAMIGAVVLAGNSVIPAAQDFSVQLPQALGEIDETVAAVSDRLDTKGDVQSSAPASTEEKATMSDQAVSYLTYEFFISAPIVAVQLISIVFLVYFTLVFGPKLFRKIVKSIPGYSARKTVLRSMRRVQRNVTRYVLVISTINMGLGLSLGLILWMAGIENYLLWGVAACLMNFIPYLGPLLTAIALAFGVYIEIGTLDAALLALGLYFVLNLLESQIVTPLALSSQLRLNPLLLFLWVMIWGWIWGAAGMFICVPLLVCVKIILASSFPDKRWIQIIE
ncbi:MAG TPA: AI-2E family transporter [Marinagarivorans sp.]